jgi:hypothetical protein
MSRLARSRHTPHVFPGRLAVQQPTLIGHRATVLQQSAGRYVIGPGRSSSIVRAIWALTRSSFGLQAVRGKAATFASATCRDKGPCSSSMFRCRLRPSRPSSHRRRNMPRCVYRGGRVMAASTVCVNAASIFTCVRTAPFPQADSLWSCAWRASTTAIGSTGPPQWGRHPPAGLQAASGSGNPSKPSICVNVRTTASAWRVVKYFCSDP